MIAGRWSSLAIMLLAACATNAAAQSATPLATTHDFRWLVGSWRGHLAGNENAVAEVTFTEPSARLMLGSMHLVERDTVLVVELISMVDSPTGLELRFRHFSPELEAYETQFKQTMRLTSHRPDRDEFENTVPYDKNLMSTQPRTTAYIRTGRDSFIGHSDIIGSDGKPGTVEVQYTRVTSSP